MSQILYYLLIKPLSLLPLPVLYRLSDLLYLILYRIGGYRKKVVHANLERAFPNRSAAERNAIERQFFKHFCDLLVESLRMFSVGKAEAIRRCRVTNAEVLDSHAAAGRRVLLGAAHYANWEMAAVGIGSQMKHIPIGIFAPLKNRFMSRKIEETRTRFRTQILHRKKVGDYFLHNTDLSAVFFIADQAPPNHQQRLHWTTFLGQTTAFMMGLEKYARLHDLPVFYAHVKKVRRGYYEVTFTALAEQPGELPEGAIMERYARQLETELEREPAYWLWTHRRWKREIPADIAEKFRQPELGETGPR